MRTVENGGVLVSPFIHEVEKRAFDWAVENGGKFIFLQENGLEERFTPKGRLHRLCVEGRLLIVAGAEFHTQASALTREQCMRLNDLAAIIAEGGLRRM